MAMDLNLICTTQSVAQAKPNSDQVLHPSLSVGGASVTDHAGLLGGASVKSHAGLLWLDLNPKFGRYGRYARLPIWMQMFDRAITYDPAERLLQRNRPRENTAL